jgi:hypothetical protein
MSRFGGIVFESFVWMLFFAVLAIGAFALCGCQPASQDRYNPLQANLITAEEEANGMNRLSAQGRVQPGDWEVYNKRQSTRLRQAREQSGVH